MNKAKILVVEDEAIIAKDLQWRLQEMGYDVPLIVASGEDAVRKIQGNNLQVVYALLDMHTDFTGDKQSADVFKGCQDRILSMSLVHKTLYKSRDLAHVDFHDYITKLVNKLFKSHEVSTDRVALRINAEHVFMGVETAIPCGLVINEIVSNSLRHAFPDGKKGEIKIGLHAIDKSKYELIISDNGIGLPGDIDFRKAETLGFRTIASFEGSGPLSRFELKRADGTEFRVKFRNA